MKSALFFFWSLLFVQTLFAGEGMWLPLLLSELNEEEMQSMGMEITAEDIYSINEGSLKDAIVRFGGGCTGSVISEEGLLLTNHHCGYGRIQQHSSVENDYLSEGYWAMDREDELRNPGLTATFIRYMEDVSSEVLRAVNDTMTERERAEAVDTRIREIKERYLGKDSTYDYVIKPFYYGNQYFLFATETFRDIRLVGAPPSSIGKFGSDSDNWMWPRHTGDFSLFRIYAGKDNRPAEPSDENVPYKPLRSLAVSVEGFDEDDFTMIFGFPGRTEEYLPKPALEQILHTINPERIAIRETLLGLLDERMRRDDATRIKYAAKYAGISNAHKKWIGENTGLKAGNALGKKEEYEAEFQKRVNENPEWKEKYGGLLDHMERQYEAMKPVARAHYYFLEIAHSGIEALNFARQFRKVENTWEEEGKEGDYEKLGAGLEKRVQKFFRDYEMEADRAAMAALFELYAGAFPADSLPGVLQKLREKENYASFAGDVYGESLLMKNEGRDFLEILEKKPRKAVKKLHRDPLYSMSVEFYDYYFREIAGVRNAMLARIDSSMRVYMKAQMEVFPGERFYPDANSTLRLGYGKVEDYEPRDAVLYKTQTWLGGVMEKYRPGDYEFDLPGKLIELYEEKDYGPYAEDGRMPVCFIASNHTTGGNSGSPVLNGRGELIGLNFDRAWEGTMSDLNYDIDLCRNIMVDVRYILFIVDKYAGAGHLVEEMTKAE